jgi:glyoxylase-like metal-dependent hydrolase (beta-lactamase superfamily II)
VSKDPGDTLSVGESEFEVIDLSGHTPGQIGLYEKRNKLLFCGDHLLSKITPTIKFWGFDYDSLGAYLNNLKKMNDFDVDHLFSAHREPIPNISERVEQMLEHHKRRLNRSLEIISEKPSNAWTVATGIKWDYLGGDFTKFAPPQHWFAANEALTHLEHLFHSRTDIRRQAEGDTFFYSIK